ncbi:MAG: response regulator, partial [Trebonia sp.]
MRLLIAEDDDALRDVLARGLTESGYVVDAVSDGEVAVAHVVAYDYELVVLDWRMPRLSGYDALAKIRARRPAVPVLMLTARDRHSDRVAGLDAGADDYLVKPF